ncbi:DNA polymerase III subunit delta [Cumulibacter manganitolerans]|uniref:DNA polymerase III subunit delta n=1 Tax=Cumulibacter manganitolerans TaxID=1884992 RepID=UPI001E332060|nr:DNA polymerase III subunit delta [Cumulibacter manganitolerans]
MRETIVGMPQIAERLVLVVGEDEFLRSQTSAKAVAAQRAARGDVELGLERVDAAVSDAANALADALSPALFGGDRIVVLKSAEQSTKDLVTILTQYAASPDPDICLVVEHSGGGRAKALATDLQKLGAAVERVPVVKSADDRIKYIRSEVVSAGGKIDAKAAAALVDAVGEDLRSLSSAARQLVSDAGGTISVDTVARYYRGRADLKVYAVADEIVAGRLESGLEQLRWALHDGAAEVVIADAIAESVRSVAKVAAAGRADPNTLAGRLGMPAWKIRKIRQGAGGWSAPGLTRAMQVAARLNGEVKGQAADPQYALEKAVIDIAAAREIR